MSILDWLIIAAVIGYLGWLLFRKKEKKCSGDCAGCCGCK